MEAEIKHTRQSSIGGNTHTKRALGRLLKYGNIQLKSYRWLCGVMASVLLFALLTMCCSLRISFENKMIEVNT